MASNPFTLGTADQQAQAAAVIAGTPAFNTSSQALLNDDLVNAQPDANSGGFSFFDELGDTALNALDVFATSTARAAAQGRNPFDPANSNFGKLQQPQTTGIGGGTLLLIVLAVVLLT